MFARIGDFEQLLNGMDTLPVRSEETFEGRLIPRQRDSQILGRNIVATIPLAFEPLAFIGESRGEPLHKVGDERVGLLNRGARLVDEARLDLLPAACEALGLLVGQKATWRSGRRQLSRWRHRRQGSPPRCHA